MAKNFFHYIDDLKENEKYISTTVDLGLNDVPVEVGGKPYDGQRFRLYMQRLTIDMADSVGNLDQQIRDRFGDDFGIEWFLDLAFNPGICTKPAYKSLTEVTEGHSAESRWFAAQQLLDDWKPGVRKAPAAKAVKVKAQKLDGLEAQAAALGMSLEEVIAFAAKLKNQ